MERPADLPMFTNPPLDEVAISAFFSHIELLTLNHQILFWQRHQEEYPEFSVQPPVMVLDEVLTDPPAPAPISAESIQQLVTNPVRRLWLESADDTRLLQVQSNMFSSNWRRRSEPYPHFAGLLDRFLAAFEDFRLYLKEQDIDPGPVTMLDVTYVNWVPGHAIQDVLRTAHATDTKGRNVDPWPAAQSHSMLYQLRRDGESVGRLSVEAQTAKRVDGESWIDGTQISLVARVLPEQERTGIESQCYFCRDAIVQAFADLITDKVSEEWGRR